MANRADLNIMEFEAYKRYKQDTDYIAAWLATNAQKCGYEVLFVSQDNGPINIEGAENIMSSEKARKEAETLKKRAAIIAPEMLHSGASTLYVRSKDLVGMAKAITKAGDVKVSDIVCDMVKRASRHRAGWSLALEAMGFNDESELLEVLLKLHGLLQDATYHEHDAKSGPVRQEQPSIDASGIVSGIDGLSFQSVNQQSSTVVHRPYVQPVIFDRGDGEIETEFVLGLSLFLWDLMARRQILKSYWMRYPDKYETTIPGIVADLLIGQARAMESDFEDTMVWPLKYPKAQYPTPTLPALLCWRLEENDAEIHEIVKDVLFNEIITKPFDHSAALRADCNVALLPQYTACQYFRKKTQHLSNAQLVDVGITSFERDERFHPEMVSALKLLQSGRCALAASVSPFGEDNLTKAVFEFQKTGYAPIWMLFGLAVQSDAIKTVRETAIERAKRGLNTPSIIEGLQDTVTSFSKAIAEVGKAKETFPQSEAEKKYYEDLGNLRERLREWVTEDKVGKWARGLPGCDCMYVKRVMSQDNWYLKETPLRAAALQYTAAMQMNRIGQCIEEHSRHVFIMAHLYKACRLRNTAIPTWPDMEFVIRRQGADRLFGGEAPNSLDGSFHKLLQACHYSTMTYEDYDKLRDDPNKTIGDAKQLRQLEDLSPFSKHGFYTQESMMTESPDTLHVNLIATLQAPNAPQQLAELCLLRPEQTAEYFAIWKREWGTDKQDGRSAWLGNTICLETWTRADSLNVNFDILALHTVCTEIWSLTLKTLKSTPTYTFPPSIDLETDPLAHQSLALDILGKASTGDTAILGILADAIEQIILEPCTPSRQHTRKVWNGDRGLAGAVFQCAKRGLEYPIHFLANDKEIVQGFYSGWIRSRLAKGLVPGAVRAWVEGEQKDEKGVDGKGVDGLRKWGMKQVW
ncbi:hypothetical protein PTMSG1_03830 [Pyrenophora teres f. maculata]|nr:hypothetical protein PTMSG1_03830 [Pyrenophora teres f. maculata]